MAGSFGGFDVGSVVGHLGLDASGWTQTAAAVQKDLKGMGAAVAKIGREFVDVGKKLAVVGIAAAAGIAAIVKATANAGDEINDMSQRTGIATEVLSSYKLVAQKTGTTLDGLAVGLRGLANNMQEGAKAGTAQARMFEALGIRVTDNAGKLLPLNDVMLDVADSFKAMGAGAERTTLAQDIFGRSGMELIPLLNLGSAGLREEAEAAARLGLVFDSVSAAAADRFNDSLADLKGAVSGLGMTIGNALIPVVRQLVEGMTSGLVVLRSKIAEFAASGQLGEWAVSAARTFVGAFKLMAESVAGLMLLLPSLKASIFSVAEGFYKTLGKIAEGISLIPSVSAQAGIALKVWAADFKDFADTYGKAVDDNNKKVSDIRAGFDALFKALDIISASFGKAGQMSLMTAEHFDGLKISTEELALNIDRLAASLEAILEPVEIPIELDLEGLGGQAEFAVGILQDLVASGAAASEAASEAARAQLALYDQITSGVINNFTSMMDGSRAMGEFFSSTVTAMIGDIGRLVIAELAGTFKIVLAKQMESVAHFISSIFKKVPFPLNIALAAGGFALVSGLFKKLLKFEAGGVFTKPTIAEVGHGTEYVLPEKKLIRIVQDAMGGGAGGGGPLSPQVAFAAATAPGPTLTIHQANNFKSLDGRTVREAGDLLWSEMEHRAWMRGWRLKPQ